MLDKLFGLANKIMAHLRPHRSPALELLASRQGFQTPGRRQGAPPIEPVTPACQPLGQASHNGAAQAGPETQAFPLSWPEGANSGWLQVTETPGLCPDDRIGLRGWIDGQPDDDGLIIEYLGPGSNADEGDRALIALLMAPDEDCLDEYFALLEKYPALAGFFAEMKRRTAIGQCLFRPDGPDPAFSSMAPVLSPSLGHDGQEAVGLKLTIAGRVIEDTAGHRSDREKLGASLNIISLYIISIDYDFPYDISDSYEIVLIFKYLSYIISTTNYIGNKNRARMLN